MTIMLDPRSGSGELLEPRNYFAPYDVEVQKCYLDAADFAFMGNGPEDEAIWVGIERKVLSDLITSKRDDRLAGSQLGKLMENYQVRGLVVEGIWRVGETGLIEVPVNGKWLPHRAKMFYRELDHFIAELEYLYGLVVETTANRAQTAAYVVSRYKFFNDHRWEEHRRCEVIYAPFTATVAGNGTGIQRGSFHRRTVPKVEKMVAQLDGVDRAAFDLGREFRNAEGLLAASVEQIASVRVETVGKDGRRWRRFGEKRAESVYRQLREQ